VVIVVIASIALIDREKSGPHSPPPGYSRASVVTVVEGEAIAGKDYARVTSKAAKPSPVGVAGPAVTGMAVGTNLAATCWVRTNKAYPAILHVSEVAPDGRSRTQERLTATSLSWTKISLIYTVALAGSRISVAAYTTGPTSTNGGGLGVDQCSLTRTRTPPPPPPVAPAIPARVPTDQTRVFTENFNRTAPVGAFDSVYGSDFAEYRGCCTTNNRTVYAPEKVLSAANGSMHYHLHSEGGTSYSAAPIPGRYLNFTYGQVGLSMRLADSVGTGYKVAFLLWPATDLWTNEVDFPEVYPDFSQGIYAASIKTTTVDGPHIFSGGPTNSSDITLSDNRYHTFLLDWRPGILTARVDGQVIATFRGSAVPAQAMHVVMQTEGWVNQGAVPAASTADIEVPWIYVNTYTP
jgi:hypothetical protein